MISFANIFIQGTLCYAIALVSHIILWRMRIFSLSRKNLLLVLTLGEALTCILSAPVLALSAWEYVGVAILTLPLILGYVITYSAMEFSSPTLSLIKLLSLSPDGVELAELQKQVLRNSPLEVRVDELVKDSTLVVKDNIYRIGPNGPSRLYQLVAIYRRCLGFKSFGG